MQNADCSRSPWQRRSKEATAETTEEGENIELCKATTRLSDLTMESGTLIGQIKVLTFWIEETEKATFNRTVHDDPISVTKRAHYEENIRKAVDLLQWCEVYFAMLEINWLDTRQEKVRKTQKNLPKARQALEVSQIT